MTTDEITTNQHKEIFMKKKSRLMLLVSFIFMVCLSGCAKWQSVINDLHGSLIGNSYSIYTYDNYGSQTLKTSGNKIWSYVKKKYKLNTTNFLFLCNC